MWMAALLIFFIALIVCLVTTGLFLSAYWEEKQGYYEESKDDWDFDF